MANLTTWVSDRLHDVVGFSDKYTVEYLIGLAKNSISPESLVQRVSEGFDMDSKMVSFANELWSRLPRKAQPVEHRYRARERELIEQQKKFMNYALVPEDDDEDNEAVKQAIRMRDAKKDKKRKYLRRKTESSSSDDEKSGKESVQEEDHPDSDEWEKEEEERKKDLAERDAFADRLKQRDKEKTRSIVERSDKKVSGVGVFIDGGLSEVLYRVLENLLTMVGYQRYCTELWTIFDGSGLSRTLYRVLDNF